MTLIYRKGDIAKATPWIAFGKNRLQSLIKERKRRGIPMLQRPYILNGGDIEVLVRTTKRAGGDSIWVTAKVGCRCSIESNIFDDSFQTVVDNGTKVTYPNSTKSVRFRGDTVDVMSFIQEPDEVGPEDDLGIRRCRCCELSSSIWNWGDGTWSIGGTENSGEDGDVEMHWHEVSHIYRDGGIGNPVTIDYNVQSSSRSGVRHLNAKWYRRTGTAFVFGNTPADAAIAELAAYTDYLSNPWIEQTPGSFSSILSGFHNITSLLNHIVQKRVSFSTVFFDYESYKFVFDIDLTALDDSASIIDSVFSSEASIDPTGFGITTWDGGVITSSLGASFDILDAPADWNDVQDITSLAGQFLTNVTWGDSSFPRIDLTGLESNNNGFSGHNGWIFTRALIGTTRLTSADCTKTSE